MPRKINKRKAIQTAKRKAAEEAASKKRHWKHSPRLPTECPKEPHRSIPIVRPTAGHSLALFAMMAAAGLSISANADEGEAEQ